MSDRDQLSPDPPVTSDALPLFVLLASAGLAHVLVCALALGVSRMLRGWLELDEAAAFLAFGALTAALTTAIEVLWRGGRPRLAILIGLGTGPALMVALEFVAHRVRGGSSLRALELAGDALLGASAPFTAALLSLGVGGALGALAWHRLRRSSPAGTAAGVL